MADKDGLGSYYVGREAPCLPGLPLLLPAPPAGTQSHRAGMPPAGQTGDRRTKPTGVYPPRPRHCSPLRPQAIPLPTHLWGRTAAPLPRRESTAGIEGGAASDVITRDIVLHGLGFRQAEAGQGLHHPGHLLGPLFTGTLCCVTFEASRAAVYVVLTAHSLGQMDRGRWAPGPSRLPPSAQSSPPTTPGYLGKRAAAPGPRL